MEPVTVTSEPVTVTAEASAAPQPEQPKLSRAEIGKLRRQYITRVLSRVVACGHSIDPVYPPANNCFECWYAYFKTNTEVMADLQELITHGGPSAITAKHGKKLTKMFARFLDYEMNQPKEVDNSPYNIGVQDANPDVGRSFGRQPSDAPGI